MNDPRNSAFADAQFGFRYDSSNGVAIRRSRTTAEAPEFLTHLSHGGGSTTVLFEDVPGSTESIGVEASVWVQYYRAQHWLRGYMEVHGVRSGPLGIERCPQPVQVRFEGLVVLVAGSEQARWVGEPDYGPPGAEPAATDWQTIRSGSAQVFGYVAARHRGHVVRFVCASDTIDVHALLMMQGSDDHMHDDTEVVDIVDLALGTDDDPAAPSSTN